ncbi:SDR family oxidoreductase [Runella zeae]|uniref:SDR family oxidoreductase n=1 Tax=Runella zeae TaxID=94255 RepID=UPI00041328CE|nr:SDR family oxidoreductase [Runella zeae]
MTTQKIILITGSSRGIGEHVAKHLAAQGHIVYGSSRIIPPDAPKNHISLDVTDSHSCQRAIERILAERGKLDVLINNAGFHLTGAAQETSMEELYAQMELNFFGAVHMIKAVLPLFLEQKSGNIINMSSIGGLLSLPFTSAYNASKFALEGYTEALRLELLPFGIFVSNLEPGYVNSGTIDQSIGRPKMPLPPFAKYREQMHRKMEQDSLKGTSKQEIAEIIEKIIDSKKPKFRYKMGGMAYSLPLMKAIMPQGFFEKTVLNSFQLPTKINF